MTWFEISAAFLMLSLTISVAWARWFAHLHQIERLSSSNANVASLVPPQQCLRPYHKGEGP